MAAPAARAAAGHAGGAGQVTSPPPSGLPHIAGLAGSGVNGYFADQYGQPRILRLEQAWALPWNAGRWNGGNWQSDMDTYFSVRASQGYTAWYGTAWSDNHVDSTCLSGGRTWDGIYPFLVNGSPGAITSSGQAIALNNLFWTRIDYLFSSALAQGISCFLNLGMQYDFTGAPNVFFNLGTAQANTFGQLVAARYPKSSRPNVFFFFGDDGNGGQDTYFTQMLSGITGTGDTRPVSIEQYPETDSHVEFDTGAIFVSGGFGVTSANYNWVYTYDPMYLGVEDAYTETGTTLLPVVWGDGWYYGDEDVANTKDYTIRRGTWWALASGARGFNNTSGPTTGGDVWQWQAGAVTDLTTDPNGNWCTSVAGTVTSYYTSLPGWHKLIPDTGSVLVTAGRGTRGTNSAPGFSTPDYGDANTYVAASRVSDGSLAVIYCRQHYSITIDQTKMQAGYSAYWVDPATCAATSTTTGSTYNSAGQGNNSAGDPDWVLVLKK
jgi:Protein of unknown function (DUF4038)